MSANSIVVTVPATTANLGCAFDCAAIALSLHLRLSATGYAGTMVGVSFRNQAAGADSGVKAVESGKPSSDVILSEAKDLSAGSAGAPPFGVKGGDLSVTYRGPNAGEIPLDERNLIVKSMRHYAARAGKSLPAANIAIENEIPLGVGLGSSAAAIVGGITLAAALCGAKLTSDETLRLALEIETHPDNLAAAVHGGMVVSAVSASGEVLVLKTEVSPKLDFVCVIPDVPLPTEKARSVLPAQYSRKDVVTNLQRAALLSAAFFSGKQLVPEMFRDTIHQPYRAPLIPGIAQCLEYRAEGLAGVFLSGAGSAIMAIATSNAQQIGEALVAEFRRAGITVRAVLLKADNSGTQVA